MANIALIFPGQGSQAIGMGKDFYEKSDIAKNIFNQADSILGRSLSKICFEGPEEELKQTINTQPAILTVSVIAYEVLKSELNLNIKFTAGHSLGEYSALYASQVLDFANTLKLVKKRSELMNNAPSGAMSAIIGLNQELLEQSVKQASSKGIVAIANYNTPDQLVITGEKDAVELAGNLASEAGAKRVIPLPVSGAFHSPLMEAPAKEFAHEVTQYLYNKAQAPVVTNIDANPTVDGFDQKLVKQIYSSVLWTQTIVYMKNNGIDTYIELGPGKVLSGMVKKIDRNLQIFNVEDYSSLEKTLASLKELANV